jgi:hypothetical protein
MGSVSAPALIAARSCAVCRRSSSSGTIVEARIESRRDHALTYVHGHPARLVEQTQLVIQDHAALAKQFHFVGEAVRDRHRAYVVPKRRIVALGRVVMQHDEVADALELDVHDPVVFACIDRVKVSVGKQFDEMRHRRLDEIDAGRLQRFDESARKSHGDAVAVPGFLAPAGDEFQESRLCQGPTVEVLHERRRGLIIADMLARIDVTVAGAMLQRDAPLPAGVVCSGTRVRQQRPRAFAGTATARSQGSQ